MEIRLWPNQEFRIEVSETQKLKVMVVSGLAEIKGQELLNEKWYAFKDIKTFIFTFSGCKLKVEGACDLQYVSGTTNVPSIFGIVNFFSKNGFDYSKLRTFMVVGNGRSTLCFTLINFFVRMGKKVLFTEIDPSRGNIFPGALSTMHVDTLIDCIEGLRLKNPLSFFYGSTEITNMELYDLQTTKLQEAIKSKNIDDLHLILCPEGASAFYNTLIKRFEVDRVIVVGNERLYHTLDVIVEKLMISRSGFVEEKEIGKSISRYFKGVNNEYTPFTFNVKYKWRVVRIGEMYVAPASALPLGSARKVGCVEASEVEISENSVLGISEAREIEDVAGSPVLGYVVVIDTGTFKILCTQPRLPKYVFLIQGDLKHIEY
ncbi:pre-mRNA cleavage complex GTPase subunit [Encephalitozoon intestinalis ATCC 50506]|uniref:Polynucleotide 5'-hydroxyl-kinase GRC3 n=1 Tax=Encephalitozoon intestinalis (strain ATCC 50506) TaxID=876142 RepID=E0S6X8_ENCIT|nr:pre-mRNA cleavage complex GTPase subunit [Encephalitozoon intestinalis ATCC 50506]ADM11564.1 pre-mRNA cleavage complex GTPase subunit [Encephalitozoon intestinalis ATCC 50506]UTX45279.1 mRNA cleavage and polyadenylation factor CLP1 [Encephalitozoon intestinalis]